MFYYVYLLRSLKDSAQTYTGYTKNLQHRLQEHNSGESVHTADLRPWELCFFSGFKDKGQALSLEKYLKSHAGRAFAAKRPWEHE